VLKKFYDRSLLWQRIIGEKDDEPAPLDAAEDSEKLEAFGAEEPGTADLVANVPLVRHRVLKLVERSTNQIHQYNNMIVSAVSLWFLVNHILSTESAPQGFANPTKSQRRFFTSRLNDMIQEGLLEKMGVPTDRGTAICVKLTDKGRESLVKQTSQDPGLDLDKSVDDNVMQAEIEDGELVWTSECFACPVGSSAHLETEDTRPSRGVGLQRQIIEMLDANPGGLIIRVRCPSIPSYAFLTLMSANVQGSGEL
jgi:oxalate---CoA ligase